MAKKRPKGTVEKQLKVYSAAAVGVLALAPSAEALIHYSGIQNLPVNSSTSQDIDFDGSGPQFSIAYRYPASYIRYVGIRKRTANASQIQGTYIAPNVYYRDAPLNLPSNYQIGPNLANSPRAVWGTEAPYNTLNGTRSGTTTTGNFNNATGFIGVRFQTSCGLAYGWIHYQGSTEIGEGTTISGTIIDWAYQDNCQPIAAGQTTDPPTAIPTLSEWGMIIFTLLLGGLAARKLGKHGREES